MRTEILIWIPLGSERCRSKAFRVAGTVDGVKSVTVAGEEKNLLLVIGDGVVDASRLTRRLRNHVGYAEIVELTTTSSDVAVQTGAANANGGGGGLPWLARVGCPVTADSVVANNHHPSAPAGMQWRHAGEAAGTTGGAFDATNSPMPSCSASAHPSPWYGRSPLGGAVAVAVPVHRGAGYALDVPRSRSHPAANYSPLIERHDHRGYPTPHNCYYCNVRRRWVPRQPVSCCTIQ
ncbi:hypothetical protein GUJ93_ZPchr0014g47458 [Zizania palustris]|uniref:HMA domain-containing protein n=1 Tax=Zizania palustris TaxID=103762 RepID=A0A8J5TA41_ZIZPA|nr:hypothetical protein GUJ93_ZPchr0014g47458 [Zizania palustris]